MGVALPTRLLVRSAGFVAAVMALGVMFVTPDVITIALLLFTPIVLPLIVGIVLSLSRRPTRGRLMTAATLMIPGLVIFALLAITSASDAASHETFGNAFVQICASAGALAAFGGLVGAALERDWERSRGGAVAFITLGNLAVIGIALCFCVPG